MEKQNLLHGVELDEDFAGHPVYLVKNEGSYFVECKKVLFHYDDYLSYLENPKEDILGYNLKGQACKISEFNGRVAVGCLKDTENKFKSIVKQVKTLIRNDKDKEE